MSCWWIPAHLKHLVVKRSMEDHSIEPLILFGSSTVRADVISEEEIFGVVFCIDDAIVSYDSDAPYEWKAHGVDMPRGKVPIIGKHRLSIIASSISGKMEIGRAHV